MPLKIRCPHCQKTLLAEDETAGQLKRCPACNRTFTVPLPLGEYVRRTDVALKCPRCGADVAPGTPFCRRCHTDMATQKRLSLRRRLRLISLKQWTTLASVVVALGLVAYIGVNVYLARFHRAAQPLTTFEPAHPSAFGAQEWAARLLQAESLTDRRAARGKLVQASAHAAAQVAEAVAAALEPSLGRGDLTGPSVWNQRAALDVLADAARDDPAALSRYAPLLETCGRQSALQEAAWRTRAVFGDLAAFEHVREVWLRAVRRTTFLARLIEVTDRAHDDAAKLVLARTRARTKWVAGGLRQLKQRDEALVLDPLLEAYWESWNWLGDQRGVRLAETLFDLAKPESGAEERGAQRFETAKLAIREARDGLSRVGQRAAPTTRAAAGLVLTCVAPQYRSAPERIARSLAPLLPECPAPVQQQLTWALARLTGRQFGAITQRNQPADVCRDDVEAVLRWVRDFGLGQPAPLTTPAEAYTPAPTLAWRVSPTWRQVEADLLRRLQQDWPQAGEALDQWLELEIGCTPRLLKLLNPGQRAPNYPALAAAFVIAAGSRQPDVRQALTLWRAARDQPEWVRQLAYAALGALDAATGRWESGWPAGFDPGAPDELDRGRPGWGHFGHILATGGKPMLDRLKSRRPMPVASQKLDRLLAAAEDAARRRGMDDRR